MDPRVSSDGDDGLRRLGCPGCGKLLLRFHSELRGGPIELKCRNTAGRERCGLVSKVFFNVGGPAWD